jgi:hypothetical protein
MRLLQQLKPFLYLMKPPSNPSEEESVSFTTNGNAGSENCTILTLIWTTIFFFWVCFYVQRQDIWYLSSFFPVSDFVRLVNALADLNHILSSFSPRKEVSTSAKKRITFCPLLKLSAKHPEPPATDL